MWYVPSRIAGWIGQLSWVGERGGELYPSVLTPMAADYPSASVSFILLLQLSKLWFCLIFRRLVTASRVRPILNMIKIGQAIRNTDDFSSHSWLYLGTRLIRYSLLNSSSKDGTLTLTLPVAVDFMQVQKQRQLGTYICMYKQVIYVHCIKGPIKFLCTLNLNYANV